MAALAKDTNRDTRDGCGNNGKEYVVKSGSTVYEGSLVAVQGSTNGYLIPWAPTGGREDFFLGVAKSKVVGDGTLKVKVNTAGVELRNVAVTGASTQAHVEQPVYADDDGTGLTLTPTATCGPIGHITAFYTATQFDVRLFTPDIYRAWKGN